MILLFEVDNIASGSSYKTLKVWDFIFMNSSKAYEIWLVNKRVNM